MGSIVRKLLKDRLLIAGLIALFGWIALSTMYSKHTRQKLPEIDSCLTKLHTASRIERDLALSVIANCNDPAAYSAMAGPCASYLNSPITGCLATYDCAAKKLLRRRMEYFRTSRTWSERYEALRNKETESVQAAQTRESAIPNDDRRVEFNNRRANPIALAGPTLTEFEQKQLDARVEEYRQRGEENFKLLEADICMQEMVL